MITSLGISSYVELLELECMFERLRIIFHNDVKDDWSAFVIEYMVYNHNRKL